MKGDSERKGGRNEPSDKAATNIVFVQLLRKGMVGTPPEEGQSTGIDRRS